LQERKLKIGDAQGQFHTLSSTLSIYHICVTMDRQ
jgi:hypothetical protein